MKILVWAFRLSVVPFVVAWSVWECCTKPTAIRDAMLCWPNEENL